MKGTTFILATAVILTSAAFTVINSTNWLVKEDTYSIKFDTKGATGIISGLKGAINFDETNIEQSSLDVTVDVNTINTGNGMKNKHAKGDGFLDVEKYPTIKFTSSKIEKTGTGFLSTGKLTIKDVTKEVVLPFTFDNAGNEGAFKSNFEINRTDYNLNRKGVGEIIKIELIIPVKKA